VKQFGRNDLQFAKESVKDFASGTNHTNIVGEVVPSKRILHGDVLASLSTRRIGPTEISMRVLPQVICLVQLTCTKVNHVLHVRVSIDYD